MNVTKRCAYRWLLLLLLVPLEWPALAVAATGPREQDKVLSTDAIDRTDNRQQWQDVKMCDVLAITGSTLTPPTTVRETHHSPSGLTPTTQSAGVRHYGTLRLSAYRHCRSIGGYIYLIRCLRL